MHTENFGPVPIARFKPDSGLMFAALEEGRRVLLSKHGRIVARIEPHNRLRPGLAASYATPGEPLLRDLNATTINQSSPSKLINEAVERGVPCFVSNQRVLYGVLHGVTDAQVAQDTPTRSQSDEIQRRINELIAERPDIDAEGLADETEAIERAVMTHDSPAAMNATNPEQIEDLPTLIGATMQRWMAGTGWFGAGMLATRGTGQTPPAVDAHRWARSLTRLADRSDDTQDAETAYETAAELGDVTAMIKLGRLSAERGDDERARAWFETAISEDTSSSPAATWGGGPMPLDPLQQRRLAARVGLDR